jgi:hypothetical protein
MTLLDTLSSYVESTGRTKISPGEPRLRDLGLLRYKINYSRPEARAEKTIKNEEAVTTKDENISETEIPNLPRGTATGAEYLAVSLAHKGLSLLFSKDETCKKLNAEESNVIPIGFRLAHHRALTAEREQKEASLDYGAKHEPVEQMASKWRGLLTHDNLMRREWTNLGKDGVLGNSNLPAQAPVVETKQEPCTKKRKRERSSMNCCVPGCTGNAVNSILKRIPDFPADLLPNKATEQKRKTFAKKRFMREERTERLGFGRTCRAKGLRICAKHELETVARKKVRVQMDCGEMKTISIEPFWAPNGAGVMSSLAPARGPGKGNGTEREMVRYALMVSERESRLSPTLQSALTRESLYDSKEMRRSNSVVDGGGEDESQWRKPSVTLEQLTAKEVKRRTGFRDLMQLLAYSAIVYAGHLEEMTKTVTKMTWLEELLFFYEFSWGRTNVRMQEKEREYDCVYNTLMKALQYRLRWELDCRVRWPMYASYEEDAELRDPSWNRHFDPVSGHRVVMHDTTNIPLPSPSSGDLNRALHNQYYNMCCAKAGVAVQLCCWIFGLPLVTGHSDDDRQIEDTKILELQQEFFENDSTSDLPFLNVFDKGYHQLLQTMRHGGQMCCRPHDADEHFGGDRVLRSGCVAVVRSGNERGVNRCKMSWFIKRGCSLQNLEIDMLCNVWEAFSFRINFMYDNFQ